MNTQMPIGVDDFKEVRENYYFVDKTHFIQSLIDGHSKVTLLTRQAFTCLMVCRLPERESII